MIRLKLINVTCLVSSLVDHVEIPVLEGKTLDDSRENLKNRETIDLLQSITTPTPHYPTHNGIICISVVNFCAHGRPEGLNPLGVHDQDPFITAGALPHQQVHG